MDDELDKSRRLDRMRKQLEAMLALLESSVVHCTPTTVSFASQEQQRQLEERAAGIKSVRVQTTAVFFVLASGMSDSVSTTHER